MTKETLFKAAENLPDQFTQDDLLLEINLIETPDYPDEDYDIPPEEMNKIMAAIEEGERAIDNGDFITHEDLKEEIKTWK